VLNAGMAKQTEGRRLAFSLQSPPSVRSPVGWLVGWLVAWLVASLVGWLVGRLVS